MISLAGVLLSPWGWLSLAAVAAAMEVALPGVYLIWVALAAALTALTGFAFSLSAEGQFAAFAVWVALSLLAARRFGSKRFRPSDQPLLNQRGAQLVGQTATVSEAIRGGRGRVRLGDGEWIAAGPDTPVGADVRITDTDGTILVVEPEGEPEGEPEHGPESGPESGPDSEPESGAPPA